jgi:hypothetical protein
MNHIAINEITHFLQHIKLFYEIIRVLPWCYFLTIKKKLRNDFA